MDQFPNHKYPIGEVSEQASGSGAGGIAISNTYRITSGEKRALDRVREEEYNELRECAEAHRQVRSDLQKWLKPGLSMLDIVKYVL